MRIAAVSVTLGVPAAGEDEGDRVLGHCPAWRMPKVVRTVSPIPTTGPWSRRSESDFP
jgi:hypothetical protein